MVFIVGLIYFFKWDFNVLEYIQFACVCSLRKILIFILFMNIPMCQPFVNMDTTCFKMLFYVYMKNYYGGDVLKTSFLMSWVDEIFMDI
jgi:hypothetical protein